MDDVIIYHKLFSRNKSGYTIQSISVDDSGETSFKENTFIYSDLGENTDYYLGIGEYACKPEEYARALDATKRTLSFWEE